MPRRGSARELLTSLELTPSGNHRDMLQNLLLIHTIRPSYIMINKKLTENNKTSTDGNPDR